MDGDADEHVRRVRARAQPRDDVPPPNLATLYRDHADFVWRCVLRFGIAEAHAEDAVHEVFLVVRRKLPQFRGDAAPTTWLYAIARGICANLRRSRQRAEGRLRLVEEPVAPEGPDDAVARRDAADFVDRILEQLPEPQREVFAMIDIEGMSAPAVATALEIPLGTVYSRLRLARGRFEAALAKEGA